LNMRQCVRFDFLPRLPDLSCGCGLLQTADAAATGTFTGTRSISCFTFANVTPAIAFRFAAMRCEWRSTCAKRPLATEPQPEAEVHNEPAIVCISPVCVDEEQVR